MSNVSQHISRQYDNELEEIRGNVLAMGGLAEQQFTNAMQALRDFNVPLAEQVRENEIKLNSCEVAIDEECVTLLARAPARGRRPASGNGGDQDYYRPGTHR